MIVGDREAIYKAIEIVLRNELARWAASDDMDEFVIERFEEVVAISRCSSAVIHRIVDAVIATGTEDHG